MRRHGLLASLLLILVLVFADVTVSEGSPPDRWTEVRSAHFVVLTDSSERDARRVASQFERMHAVFHAIFPTKGDDTDPPIEVLALKDRKAMQALEPEAYLGRNQVDLAGLFVRASDKNYILVRLDAHEEHAFATVYHEYTHYILRKTDAWLPLWLNEGLAEFYENTDIGDKEVRFGQGSAEDLHYLSLKAMLPLTTLLAVDTRSPYYHDEQKGSVFYAESWVLTHYLIATDRMEGRHRVRDYAELLVRGEDPVTAARHAFGDLDRLQQALGLYVQQQKFMYFTMVPALTAKESTFEVRPVPPAEADAVRGDVLVDTERGKEAQALLEDVLRADPGNALAREAMGRLRFREGDIAGAKKWYGEAVERDSHSYLAHYYYAVMLLDAGDAGRDETIESSLETAIKLNPEFAPACDALAMFYGSRHLKLEEAHRLSVRAVELEPERLSYRLNEAEVLAQERQFTSALGELKSAMRLAKTPAEIDSVKSRVRRIEGYQALLAKRAAPSSVSSVSSVTSVTSVSR